MPRKHITFPNIIDFLNIDEFHIGIISQNEDNYNDLFENKDY